MNKQGFLKQRAAKKQVSVLDLIKNALSQTSGNKSEAAKLLGCSAMALDYHLTRARLRIVKTHHVSISFERI